jgi:RNA polymerase-binding transcription factor DksA
MTTETARYEEILRARSRELSARLHRIDTDLGRAKNPDSADRALEAENDEVLEELGEAGETELKAIDAALARIARGTFGTCTQCGATISPQRLAAVPHTPICQDCAAGR